jgi:uncharacterized protein (DUF362 family)
MKRPPPPPRPPRPFTRREALQLAVTATAGGVVLGGALLARRAYDEPRQAPAPELKDHRVARPAGALQLAMAHGPDARANVRRALEAMGGMGAFIKAGERVVIKPNVGWNRVPEQAANTNPEVVEEVIRQVRAAGASTVWVADVPVNAPERCFERSGIRAAAGAANATVVMPDGNAFREVKVGGQVLSVADVLWPFVEADKVINVPLAKHHGLSGATASMKNWYGVLGGHRVRLHQDLHRSIVDLAAMVKPTLTILDATRVLLANGPTGGSLADVKRLDLVAISTDEVALDALAAQLLGLQPAEVGFIAEAEKRGLGTSQWRRLRYEDLGG